MKEIVKRRWLTDNDNQKIAPKTTIDQILMEDGSRFENEWQKHLNDKDYVTPQMFGALADGVHSDSDAIDQVCQHHIIFFPKGDYIISRHISFLSDTVVIFEPGCTLSISNQLEGIQSYVIKFYEVNNISIYFNNTIVRGSQSLTSSSLSFYGANNIKIYDIDLSISKTTKDCINLGKSSLNKPSKNILIKGGKIHDAGRNGISVISATNVVIDGVEIYNNKNQAPEAGIDIEANELDPNNNIYIKNCYIHDNGGAGIDCIIGKDIYIENNLIKENASSGIVIGTNINRFDLIENRNLQYITKIKKDGKIYLKGVKGLLLGSTIRFYSNKNDLPEELINKILYISYINFTENYIYVSTALGVSHLTITNPKEIIEENNLYCIFYIEEMLSNVNIINNIIKNNNGLRQIELGDVSHICIRQNKIQTNSNNLSALSSSSMTRFLLIENNTFEGSKESDAMDLYGNWITVKNNNIYNFGRMALYSSYGFKVIYCNNNVINSSYALPNGASINLGVNVKYIIFTDNYIQNEGSKVGVSIYSSFAILERNIIEAGSSVENCLKVSPSSIVHSCILKDGSIKNQN